MRRVWLLAAAAAILPAPVLGQQLSIAEWPVPWERTRPRDPYVAPDGRIWFCGQAGHYLAVFDPATGDMRRYDLEEGAGPHNLIVGDDGIVWYSGNRRANIGRLDPATGEIELIPMPDGRARDPHTLEFDGNGNIWFSAQGANVIGFLNTETREVRLLDVPTPRARPYGIKVAPDGRVWVDLFGTNKLAVIDTATFELTEIELPREEARPRRLVITSDGRVWYGDYRGGMLGAYDPATGEFEEHTLPSAGGALPYGMAVDADDRIWLVEVGPRPNRFIGFDPGTNEFFAGADIPSGGGAVRHMFFHGPTNTIWFGTDSNNLGRATLPPAGAAIP